MVIASVAGSSISMGVTSGFKAKMGRVFVMTPTSPTYVTLCCSLDYNCRLTVGKTGNQRHDETKSKCQYRVARCSVGTSGSCTKRLMLDTIHHPLTQLISQGCNLMLSFHLLLSLPSCGFLSVSLPKLQKHSCSYPRYKEA
jgi:hypothetical protein